MKDGNKDVFGTKFTYGLVVRGDLSEVNKLVEFLKQSDLVVAYSELGQEKLYISKAGDNDY